MDSSMNIRAAEPVPHYSCLACDALNVSMQLHAEEGFQYIPIQSQSEDVVTSFVAHLNRLLNRIKCSVCVQRDSTYGLTYWLSFRFIEIDRHAIRSIISADSVKQPSFAPWMLHIVAILGDT